MTKIEQEGYELHLYFEEKKVLPEGYSREELESKGFHNESIIKDFPIREKPLSFARYLYDIPVSSVPRYFSIHNHNTSR